jgi:thiol-disulfide isomerase/thioredoxin
MRILSLFIAILCSANIFAVREKVIETPYWAKSDASALHLKKITLSDTATILYFNINEWGMETWSLSPTVHLEADGKNYKVHYSKKYSEKTGNEIPFQFGSPNHIKNNISDSLIAVFDPLPKKTKAFDFIEGNSDRNSWRIFDIRTINEPYSPIMKVATTSKADETLEPFVPKAGKAILNIRYHGSKKKYEMTCGNFVVSDFIMKEGMKWTQDTTGSGIYKAEILCLNPIYVDLLLPYFNGKILLEPEKELTIDLDIPTLVNKEIEKDKRYKSHNYGEGYAISGNLAIFNKAIMTHGDYRWSLIDSLVCDTTISFKDYVKKMWNKCKTRISEIDSDPSLSHQQKVFMRWRIENDYVEDRMNYADHIKNAYIFKYWDTPTISGDSIGKIKSKEAERQATLVDPHANELTLFKDMRAAYITSDTKKLKYMDANGITSGAFYIWLKDKRKAEAIADELNALHPLSDIHTLDSISPVYVPLLRQLNDTAIAYQKRMYNMQKTNICKTDAEKNILSTIVEQYKGSVVFVDCWATWCGPCNRGIKAMRPIEKELSDKNVKFIFLTDISSPIKDWTEMIQTMPGYHYRLTDKQWSNLPAMNGIPRYFIFDRNGKQLLDMTGWSENNVEKFKNIIQQAINE